MTDWALPQIDPEKCDLCGACVNACPHQVLKRVADKLVFVQPQACTYCGLCESSCPQNAVVCSYEIGWA